MSNEIVIDYSEVESDYIDVDELVKNPSQFLILDLKTVINCRRCRKRLTIRKSEKTLLFCVGVVAGFYIQRIKMETLFLTGYRKKIIRG